MAKKAGKGNDVAPATLSDVDGLFGQILRRWKPIRGDRRGQLAFQGVKAIRDLNQVLCRLAGGGGGDSEFGRPKPPRRRRRS